MTPHFQTLLALAVVAVAACWLVLGAVSKKKKPGCGGDCGCSVDDKFKAKLKKQ